MLAMSVAGFTLADVSALYRETLARVVREGGADAVDTDVAHLVYELGDDGRGSIRIVEEAFDLRPMFHGVQVAAGVSVAAAAEAARLEPRVLQPNGPRRKSRFAFVIHPLSQEYLSKVEPLRTMRRVLHWSAAQRISSPSAVSSSKP